MIGALLLALQLGSATAIQVRAGGAVRAVEVERIAHGATIPLDALAASLSGTVAQLPGGWTRFIARGVELELAPAVPFARAGQTVIPLVSAPVLRGSRLYVPAQLATEILPRLAPSLRYDAARRELALVSPPGERTIVATSGGSTAAASPGAAPQRTPPRAATTDRKRVVVVDAGHGGKDNGTSGLAGRRRIYEKDIALAVALALRDSLRKRGVTVVMTRDDDTFIPLSDRGRYANQHEGDLFLSIHVNAANPRARDRALVRGFETFFLAEARTEDAKRVQEMENEVIRFETGADAPKDDPLSFIINDMAQNEHLRESSDLAEVVQQRLARMHPGPNRGVKQADFYVLRTAFMPAVLIEIGFATNATEAAYIAESRRQRQLAGSIAEAAIEYLEHYERRIGGAPH